MVEGNLQVDLRASASTVSHATSPESTLAYLDSGLTFSKEQLVRDTHRVD